MGSWSRDKKVYGASIRRVSYWREKRLEPWTEAAEHFSSYRRSRPPLSLLSDFGVYLSLQLTLYPRLGAPFALKISEKLFKLSTPAYDPWPKADVHVRTPDVRCNAASSQETVSCGARS